MNRVWQWRGLSHTCATEIVTVTKSRASDHRNCDDGTPLPTSQRSTADTDELQRCPHVFKGSYVLGDENTNGDDKQKEVPTLKSTQLMEDEQQTNGKHAHTWPMPLPTCAVTISAPGHRTTSARFVHATAIIVLLPRHVGCQKH